MGVRPRYLDIAAQIRNRIEASEWRPGAGLPRLDDLAGEYKVNRNTIARAIKVLEADGYLRAVQGSGVTVRYDATRTRHQLDNVVKRDNATRSYRFPPTSSVGTWKDHISPTAGLRPLNNPRIAQLLDVDAGIEVMQLFSVTGPAAELPFQINTSWIHPRVTDIFTEADANPTAGEWLYLIEKAGHWPIGWVEFFNPRMPSEGEAAMLQIPASLPVLEIVRLGNSGADGQPVEVTEQVVAGDRAEIVRVPQRDEVVQDLSVEDV
jgi:DNA-binding GntR family transcriptional regulator